MALRDFLLQRKSLGLQVAAGLGRRAASIGLETLDVAQVHEQALSALAAEEALSGLVKQGLAEGADIFFSEVIVPIEARHRAAREADASIDRLSQKLQQRATESSASEAQLKRAVASRKEAEASSDAHELQSGEMIAELQRRQEGLRASLRSVLSEQEGGWSAIGGELRNEIAQALLAIHLSLLALKTDGGIDTEKLEKSIDEAQRLLKQLQHKQRQLVLERDGA
jgi:hypothetical protein